MDFGFIDYCWLYADRWVQGAGGGAVYCDDDY
jgi:hypothetical protein